jgi:hypothetical protein
MKSRTYGLLTLLCILFIIAVGCKKEHTINVSKEKELDPKAYTSLHELFKATIDSTKLADLVKRATSPRKISDEDSLEMEAEARTLLLPSHHSSRLYLLFNYPDLLPGDSLVEDDCDFTYFSRTYSILEDSGLIVPNPLESIPNARGTHINTVPPWLRCTIDIVLGYFDVQSLISSLGTFEFHTVWRAINLLSKSIVDG